MHCILCTVQLKGIEKQGHCVHFVRIVLPGKGIVLQRKGIVCAFSKSSSARWPLLLEPRAVAATILNWMMVKMMMMTIMMMILYMVMTMRMPHVEVQEKTKDDDDSSESSL